MALSAKKLLVLSTLYFAQGLPFGFQATALPAYLRQEGLSLTSIGFLGLLTLPWSLKVLWAPWVDRYALPRLGRRLSWILPMQALMALCAGAAALLPPSGFLPVLLGLVLLMNFCAATQDIAVDGLAVELLSGEELGPGNAAQVVGYKLGMLTGGGLLVWASGQLGWQGLFVGMALLLLGVMAVALWGIERPSQPSTHALPPASATTTPEQPPTSDITTSGRGQALEMRSEGLALHALLKRLQEALTVPGTGWLLLFIGTYKLGESMVDVMFKPFLVDAGFTPAQLGLWMGTYGMAASLLGSLLGGWASLKLGRWESVALASVLRVGPLALQWWLSLETPSEQLVILSTLLEHLFGGMLTSTVFAFMMSTVDREIGGTHYTLLATVEVIGKSPSAWLAGMLAQTMGYSPLFLLGTALSALFLLVLLPLRRLSTPPR